MDKCRMKSSQEGPLTAACGQRAGAYSLLFFARFNGEVGDKPAHLLHWLDL